MSTQYKGKGFVQVTGSMNTMPSLTTVPLSTINLSSASASASSWPSNISLSGQSYNTVSLDLSDYNRHPEVKKYEVFESPEDVIVLAATWKRLRDSGNYSKGISKLMDYNLFKEITSVDRTKAAEIRDYYSKKIMMWTLKGHQLTSYRRDLSKLIQNDGMILREDQFGIAYHLPAFYEYDQEFEEIRLSTTHTNLKTKSTGVVELQPLKRMFRKTRSNMRHEYWFKTKNDEPALITLSVKNPLQHIWDKLFDSNDPLQIDATMIHKQADGFEYYLVCEKWQLQA
jgi:hypothetical protein